MNIKKGDTVTVISGRNLGQQGVVEQTIAATNRVVVAGVNIRKRHLKPSQSRPKGGIAEMPAPIPRANVMLVCPHCSKPTRVKHTVDGDTKFRACIKCGDSLDGK